MARRFLTLYYGSIGVARAFQALGCWVTALTRSPSLARAAVTRAVRAHLGNVDVFPMGSGRSALAACLQAGGIGPGDEVLLTAYTCLAVPTAVIAAGAKPVYVDINAETLNADPDAVLGALSSRVRAVVVQHTLGKVASVQAIVDGARKKGVLVIEDCALAVGSSVGGRYVGTFGDAAIFSMELSKTMSCGWGGVLVVSDLKLSAAVTRFYADIPEPSWWASTRDIWQTAISALCYRPGIFDRFGKYVLAVGFSSRLFRLSTPERELEGRLTRHFMRKMGKVQACLAALQWQELGKIASACEAHAREIRRELQDLRIPAPGAPASGEVSVTPRVSFLVTDRQAASAYFRARGIELGQWFDGPLSPAPASPLFNFQAGRYPQAEKVAKSVVNLPCHCSLAAVDLARILVTLSEFVRDRPYCVERSG